MPAAARSRSPVWAIPVIWTLLGCALAAPVHAQRTARVSGTVHDSTRGWAVPNAVVQLVARQDASTYARTVVTDSLGRYAFDEVPSGEYLLGFHHPVLDSLGIEAGARAIAVQGSAIEALLAVPSAAHIRSAVCQGVRGTDQPPALVLGYVRDARTRAPLAGATVSAEWVEYTVRRGQLMPRTTRRTVRSAASGWYALCDVPRDGYVVLAATHEADSTDRVEVRLFSDGLQRRELVVGASRTRVDTVVENDSVAIRLRRVGDMRLRGVVHRAGTRQPLADALVSVSEGAPVRTNAQGEFVIANAPAGTRLLEVRAVGYYPDRLLVEVVDGTPDLSLSLETFTSVLDTVKVLANYQRYSALQEFTERARSGLGRFLTAADIARQAPMFVSDLFRMVPGMFVDGLGFDMRVTMRGLFSSRCMPAVYLNGFPFMGGDTLMPPLSAMDFDSLIRTEELHGIEIYAAGQVPPQFQLGMTGCGTIVLWTR
jgi:hypothetical protein